MSARWQARPLDSPRKIDTWMGLNLVLSLQLRAAWLIPIYSPSEEKSTDRQNKNSGQIFLDERTLDI